MKSRVLILLAMVLSSLIINAQDINLNYEQNKKNALTIGLLNGGGLIGAELETLLKGNFGVHVGVGFVGACMGLNFHLKPTTNSSFFTAEVRAQGIGDSYIGTTAGIGYVIRYRGFSMQLGGAYLIDKGPNTVKNWNTRSFVPQISLRFYNPF